MILVNQVYLIFKHVHFLVDSSVYKDEITVKAAQSPLFSCTIFAKVVKIIEKSWHTIKKSCRVITTGQDTTN